MLKLRFPETPFMALTATATEKVKLDVMKQLKMKQGTTSLFKSSFDRPNLSWIIQPKNLMWHYILFISKRYGRS